MRVILVMGLVWTLISCGQSGDLYLSAAQEKAIKSEVSSPNKVGH
jgi:hypothetical protein